MRRQSVPFGKAARAMRRVSSGTAGGACGRSDIASASNRGAHHRPQTLDTLPRPRDHLAGEFATSVTVGNGPISLAQMLRDQGRSVEAFALLQPVYDRFTEGFATADLKAAKALLDELA